MTDQQKEFRNQYIIRGINGNAVNKEDEIIEIAKKIYYSDNFNPGQRKLENEVARRLEMSTSEIYRIIGSRLKKKSLEQYIIEELKKSLNFDELIF